MVKLKNREEVRMNLEVLDNYLYGKEQVSFHDAQIAITLLLATFGPNRKRPKGGCKG